MVLDETSALPSVSIWRWMPLISRSTRSGATLRLRQARATDCSILVRSKGSRRLSLSASPLTAPVFSTVISRSCTRSKVVKRAPQPSHWRRRRIAVASSVGRESFTWLVSWAQKGQRIYVRLRRNGTGPLPHPATQRVPRLGVAGWRSGPVRIIWSRSLPVGQAVVDRELGTKFLDPRLDAGFHLGVAGLAVLAQAIDHLGDPLADLDEFGLLEAAGGAGRGAQADARGDHGLF